MAFFSFSLDIDCDECEYVFSVIQFRTSNKSPLHVICESEPVSQSQLTPRH